MPLREVVQAERLAVLGNFARSIVHDLKTPLTIISLSTEIGCAPNSTPEKRAESRERIRKQVWRINDMVGDILEFSRGSRTDAEKVVMEFPQFISDFLEELQAEAATKSTTVICKNEPPAGRILMHSRRLRRVFFNLMHNSVEAMPGGGQVFLTFRTDGQEMITELEDTGPGVAPQVADKLFQPFVTFGKTQGTGLGLSICKKIVKDHKGRLWARTLPGRGAIFCFSLPLAN